MKFYPFEPVDAKKSQLRIWQCFKETFRDDDGIAYYKYPVFFKHGETRREPDIIVLHRLYGICVVEVEGCEIGNLAEVSPNQWTMRKWNEEIIDPIARAEDMSFAIKRIVESHRDLRKIPIHIDFKVALPKIERSEWIAKGFDQIDCDDRLWFRDDVAPDFLRKAFASDRRQNELSDDQWALVQAVLRGPLPSKPPRPIPSGSKSKHPLRVLNAIESKLKTLDEMQQQIAYFAPEGPQRLRGLAGTGKTVLMAKRAAKIHAKHPDYDIAFVFYTRSLYEQVRNLIQLYYRELTDGEEPNMDKLRVLHSWGGRTEPGFYYDLAIKSGVKPLTVNDIKEEAGDLGRDTTYFEYACRDLEQHRIPEVYDVVLIDEGQDLPPIFYRLVFNSLRTPKRLYWAYDEAQGIGSLTIPDSRNLFGTHPDGTLKVDVSGSYEGAVQKSYRMNKCYRTHRLLLMVAHAINMGLFRKEGVLQGVSSKKDWETLGYEVLDGDFTPASVAAGRSVTITRLAETSVHPINQKDFPLLESIGEPLVIREFANEEEELEWVAEQIANDLKSGLSPNDIMVTAINSNNHTPYFKALQDKLERLDIQSYVAGEKNPNLFRIDHHITLSSIYRAKGNEAWKVYVTRFHNTTEPLEWKNETETHKRNEAFVALTRSKLWCVVTGLKKYPIYDEMKAALHQYPKFTFPAFNKASLQRTTDDE
jgi:superfamily I DNA and RNA helicase